MTPEDYAHKKKLAGAFEILQRNYAYEHELLPLFQRLFRDALAGLRDRGIPREKRDEYLVAAEHAERLAGFVDERLAALRRELRGAAEEGEE